MEAELYRSSERLLRFEAARGTRLCHAAGVSVEYEDVFQDLALVFTRAMRHWTQVGGAKFATYLTKCCRHRITNMVQAGRRGKRFAPTVSYEGAMETGAIEATMVDGAPTAEQELLRRAEAVDCLAKLPRHARALVQNLISPAPDVLYTLERTQTNARLARANGQAVAVSPNLTLDLIRRALCLSDREYRQARKDISIAFGVRL